MVSCSWAVCNREGRPPRRGSTFSMEPDRPLRCPAAAERRRDDDSEPDGKKEGGNREAGRSGIIANNGSAAGADRIRTRNLRRRRIRRASTAPSAPAGASRSGGFGGALQRGGP